MEKKKEKSAENNTVQLAKLLIWSFFLAPAPFYMCFDGYLGLQFIVPLVVAWLPWLTIFSFFSLRRLVWHLLFMIPFILLYIPCVKYIDNQQQLSSGKKKFYKFVLYMCYWIVITLLWGQIPIETRYVWLGQEA